MDNMEAAVILKQIRSILKRLTLRNKLSPELFEDICQSSFLEHLEPLRPWSKKDLEHIVNRVRMRYLREEAKLIPIGNDDLEKKMHENVSLLILLGY